MAHTSVGFKGSVDQVAWSKLMANAAPRFSVVTDDSWTPTAVTTADRTVRVSAGAALGSGVQDSTDSFEDVQFDPNGTSSDRFDLLVATWIWTTSGGSVSFGFIKGTAGAGVPTASALTRTPGVRYDGVIAVVRVRPSVGAFSSADVADARVIGGNAGALVSIAGQHIGLVDLPAGGILRLPATTGADPLPTRDLILRDGLWRLLTPSPLPGLVGAWSEPPGQFTGNPTTLTQLTVPDPGFAYRLSVLANCEVGSVSEGTRWDMYIRVVGSTSGELDSTLAPSEPVGFQRIYSPISDAAYTGQSTVIVAARRAYGSAAGAITGFNKRLRVYRHAA